MNKCSNFHEKMASTSENELYKFARAERGEREKKGWGCICGGGHSFPKSINLKVNAIGIHIHSLHYYNSVSYPLCYGYFLRIFCI